MNIKTLFGFTLAASAMASCSVEEQELPAEELYTRAFYKEFGLVDKNQDWNVVEQKSITINTNSPAHVKVYEMQNNEYRLAADYENVTDGQTITFDGTEGDNSLFLVSINGLMLSATNGATVGSNSSAPSRARRRTSLIENNSPVTKSDSYTEVPLITDNTSPLYKITKDGQDNSAGLTQESNFLQAQQDKAQTYYPVFWNSKNHHTVGIFYTEDGKNITTIPIYKDHEGDEVQYYFEPQSGTSGEAGWQNATNDNSMLKDGYTVDASKGVHAKGFTVNLDKGKVYGMYVQIGEKIYYSAAELNTDKQQHFATYIKRYYDSDNKVSKTHTYLMFDDPTENNGKGDKDFNDLVFYIPEQLTPITEQEVGWTVACEDLGGTYDFDFNDLVFRVYHTAGYDYATIQPLAAGGTLPAYLKLVTLNDDGTSTKNDVSKEWHSYFGAGNYTSSTMINTFSITETKNKLIKIEGLGRNFTMTKFAKSLTEAGGFMIDVTQANGLQHSIIGPTPSSKTPSAPQILVLPLNWHWPVELVDIRTVYKGGSVTTEIDGIKTTTTYPSFSDWAKDVTQNQGWVNYYVNDKALYIDGLNYDTDNVDTYNVYESNKE